jgi:hypothetical protein
MFSLSTWLQVIDAKNFRVQIDEHKNCSSFPETFHQIAFAVTPFCLFYPYHFMVYFGIFTSSTRIGRMVLYFVYSCCCS